MLTQIKIDLEAVLFPYVDLSRHFFNSNMDENVTSDNLDNL